MRTRSLYIKETNLVILPPPEERRLELMGREIESHQGIGLQLLRRHKN
jgi:hypothetical protein